MNTVLVAITAVVVFTYLLAMIKRNLKVQFWALVTGVIVLALSTVEDFATEAPGWYILIDGVLLLVWGWLAYVGYKDLRRERANHPE